MSPDCLPACPAQDLFDAVQDFYGTRGDISADSLEHLGVPSKARGHMDFVIAIVADPVHTHLSLFFDRTIEAIQQGAQEMNYFFARATMPWDNHQHPESTDWHLRVSQKDYERDKSAQPGLMIFRERNTLLRALFVFVVGEAPTGGIHKDQFHHALEAIRMMGETGESFGGEETLRILGPTFSGSLYSLAEILDSESSLRSVQIVVHSGSVSSGNTVDWFSGWFNKYRDNPTALPFMTFQESDQYAIARFIEFARQQDYEAKYIVLLSEDETAYGSHQRAQSEQEPTDAQEDEVVHLYFPRDISQLRSAYQQDLLKAESGSDKRFTPRTTLPLNLEDTGSDDDSVPSYAHRQTPLSQEAVLLGIVTNLKSHHAQFVVIRATNPLDELFLSRYLRVAYPQVRIVTIGADLLFQREKDDARLQGIWALTPYPLLPGADDLIARPRDLGSEFHADRIFPSSFSAGIYNAMLSLLPSPVTSGKRASPGELSRQERAQDQRSPAAKYRDLPVAPYTQYGWPNLGGDKDPAAAVLAPPLWLVVLGRDGYWPLALLDSSQYSLGSPHIQSKLHAINAFPSSKTFKLTASQPWILFICVVIAVVLTFILLCWYGSITSHSEVLASFANSPDRGRTHGLVVASMLLLAVVCSLLWPWERWRGYYFPSLWRWGLWIVFLLLFASCVANLWKRKAKIGTPVLGIIVLGTVPVLFHFYKLEPASSQNLLLYRSYHITSGVSPLLPCYLLVAAGLWWAWYSLAGLVLLDDRRPLLPAERVLPSKRPVKRGFFLTVLIHLIVRLDSKQPSDLSDEGNRKLVEVLRSAFSNWQVCRWIVLPPALVILGSFLVVDCRHPLHSLEGEWFDLAYFAFLALAVFTLLCDLLRLAVAWLQFRHLLKALERIPLRRGFDSLKDFSWRPIWRLGGDVYRVFFRAKESALHFANALQLPQKHSIRDQEMIKKLKKLTCVDFERDASEVFDHAETFSKQPRRAEKLQGLYKQLAETCGFTLQWLETRWQEEREKEEEKEKGKEKEKTKVGTTESSAAGYQETIVSPGVKSAERFVCFIYLNFILSVLLRMRTLVFTIGGMYVLILLSVSSYPFEPRLAIRSLMVLLLFLILGCVAFVYAQMHRDATLSRITRTEPGELGLDFWVRLVGFAALPLVSLLAAQFPAINNFLFSWLQPALDAVR